MGDPKFYAGLGLRRNVHFLAHDGSVEGIIAVMDGAKRDITTLKRISKNGALFVEKNFRSRLAFERLRHVTDNLLEELSSDARLPN